ncbi:hypothetical protein IWW55_007411, partial [Coemansia sp. RSA 2706]
MRLEERASQQWLKDRRVLVRVLQKLLNRNRRWRRGEPAMRMYLPPVPLDGTDADIRDEYAGAVRIVKMKAGTVAVVHERARAIRLWSLADEYEQVKQMTTAYIAQNRAALEANRRHDAPPLPPFGDAQVDALLRCARGGPQAARLSVIRTAAEPLLLDFFHMNATLATASAGGRVDVYDMRSGRHRRTLRVAGAAPRIDSVHVWLKYVVASHGSSITMWNHETGAVLEDALPTAHRASITGVFVLDDEQHLLSIDARGVMVVTDRRARRPDVDTLMDVPLYPVILAGAEGAPYSMRLLHMTHLCVWGRYAMGHYELYEPGLRNMPPLNSLIIPEE